VGATQWAGQPIGSSAIVGKYTYFGDMNLDGQVTGDDYTVDSNLNTTPLAGLAWPRGDANLDGIITGDDYTVIDANLGKGVGNPLAPTRWSEQDRTGSPPGRDALTSPKARPGIIARLWQSRACRCRRRHC